MESLLYEDQQVILNVYNRLNLEIVKGEGSYLYDKHGNTYLDMSSGLSVNSLGYLNEEIKEAILKQAEQYLHLSNDFISKPEINLAKLLIEYSNATKVLFSRSGKEASESALKLARKYGQSKHPDKIEIIRLSDSYNGRTYREVSLSDRPKAQDYSNLILAGFKQVEMNNIDDLNKQVNKNTAAFFLELIQGEAGVKIVSQPFIDQLVRLSKQYDFLIVVDEVQTGLGRTGDLFAYQRYQFTPHLVTLAKSLGGGIPLGALLISHTLEDVLSVGEHDGISGGNPLACAVGEVIIKTVSKPRFLKSVKARGFYLKQSIEELARNHPDIIKDVSGRGLMIGIDVGEYLDRIKAMGLQKGFIINGTKQTVIRLLPPLTINYEEIDAFLLSFEQILKEIENGD